MLLKKQSVLISLIFILTPSWALEISKVTVDAKSAAVTTGTQSVSIDTKKTSQANALTDLSKPITVTSNLPAFTIRLAANLVTGYQWYLADHNPRFVRLLGQQYISAPNKIIGAPGISVWQFQLQQISFIAPQVTRITFEYRRPWEPKAIKKQSFTVISQQPTKGS